jgi:hypothetical protein
VAREIPFTAESNAKLSLNHDTLIGGSSERECCRGRLDDADSCIGKKMIVSR